MAWTSRVISKLTSLDEWINSLSVDHRVGLSPMLGGTSGAAASLAQIPFLGDTPKHVAVAAALVGALASIGIGAVAASLVGGGVLLSTVVGFVAGITISVSTFDAALASALGVSYITAEIWNFFGNVWGGQGSGVAIEGNDVQRFDYGSDSVFAVDNAKIYGEWGDDYLVAHDNAKAFGGDGNDTLRGASHAVVHGENGQDNITVFENAAGYGGDQNDELYALGNAKIFGEGGDDILSA